MLIIPVFCIFSRGVGGVVPGVGPFIVSILIWSIGLNLGGTTGYALNPARDLGPRLAHAVLPIANKGESDWDYAWVPVVGPLLGAVLSFAILKMICVI